MSELTAREQAFQEAYLQLLPRGAYARAGLVAAEAEATARHFARVEADALALIDWRLPPLRRVVVDGRTVERLECPAGALPEWERLYGLPSSGSYELRNARLLAAIRLRMGLKPVDLQTALEPLLGYRPPLIERELFRADSPGSLMDQDQLVEPEEEVYRGFIVISGADARAGHYTRGDVTRLVDETQASGVLFEVVFTGFFCDDPNSLTDLDLMEV